MTRITVLMGAPGCGKSTWCEHHAGDAVVISVDAIKNGADPRRTFAVAEYRAKLALCRGSDVIIDACSTRWRDRAVWVRIARAYTASTRLVIIDTPPSICKKRDAARPCPVGRAAIYAERVSYAKKRVVDEGWDEIVVVGMSDATEVPA